ncbi:phosphatidylserine decarboxylase [Litoribrevibacter albus]|uniref:Phosphatidylserine decarboxylase proenzyme 2 n=1 Tax=Litoribrevibacter albus TaxID=1473156 RepID=A0AA37S7Z2_9GAMM|nr:phosphatidylserine decarboxylase [Litoribrevibacter albus]GLQ29884.1 phosphatidylserine decarboxylase proenzyme 2 [Litoribrevibacter albus]
MLNHQYIDKNAEVIDETLFADRIIQWLYSSARERSPTVFKALTGSFSSKLLAHLNFDMALTTRLLGNKKFLKQCGVNLEECIDPPESFTTARRIFERKIKYWECRPQPDESEAIISPADSRMLIGSFDDQSPLLIKDKFFRFEELLGEDKTRWLTAFDRGDFAIFRLTPDKYHFNHVPVSGKVVDIYELDGHFHSCNPGAIVKVVTPYSKNRRVVTIIDTDIPGGSNVGLVAMIEVVALMIGEIEQCYSDREYDSPVNVEPGLFLKKGQPKSLYHPGSSTDVLIFQKDRIQFSEQIIANLRNEHAKNRFNDAFNQPLIETDVAVRSLIAMPANPKKRQVSGLGQTNTLDNSLPTYTTSKDGGK